MNAAANPLAAHARFRPDAVALIDDGDGRVLTYADLYRASLCWCGRLRREGVKPGNRVAVLAANCADTLALLFACAELGATLLLVNWRLSDVEISWQLTHAGVSLVLADAENLSRVPGAFPLEDGPGDEASEGPGLGSEDAWVLLYTSGTTGRPKGALLPWRQIVHNAATTTLACDLLPSDVTVTFAPLFHTGGLNCLTTPLLLRGATVVLQRSFGAAAVLQRISQAGVTLLMGVPTHYQLLATHPDFATAGLGSVRDALVGGAPLPASLATTWLTRGVTLRQGFGLTEVGPNVFSTPPRFRDRTECVGLPNPGVSARLCRPDGSVCAVDEPGELELGGPLVFKGYLNDAPATAAALRDGWFRTGDVLSKDVDGLFCVRGRLKEMYKSGGENVYPAEVEAVILGCPSVAMAAVLGVPDAQWGEVGVAFVEASAGQDLPPDAVFSHMHGRLARFKHPKRVIMGALPRTASGKVDKALLRTGFPC